MYRFGIYHAYHAQPTETDMNETKTMPNGKTVPAIRCELESFDRGKEVWSFYCNHCRKRHIHGGAEGHRVAHCLNEASPFIATGYWLLRPLPVSAL